jgi:hypothetical protein
MRLSDTHPLRGAHYWDDDAREVGSNDGEEH